MQSGSHRPWLLTLALAGAMTTPAHARTEIDLARGGRYPEGLYTLLPPNTFVHNAGLLSLQITNMGVIGNPVIEDYSAGWRNGEYLYLSGIWFGAIGSDSEPHVSTSTDLNALEFRPEIDNSWTVRESFEGAAGGNRLGEGDPEAADDDRDGQVDEDFLDGFDNDGDRLEDEDFEAIGQQMFACRYKDDTPQAVTQISSHVPLNVEVAQRSFQWSTPGINEFVGLDFTVRNTGEQRLKEIFIGFFSDTDAGPKTMPNYYDDDLVGWAHIETTFVDPQIPGDCAEIDIKMDTAFMWDAPDNGSTILGGDVPGMFGSLFLGHTTDDTGLRAPQVVGLTTVAWFSRTGQNNDPANDDERYQLMGRHTKPMRNPTKPEDYRYLIVAGPFSQLYPGESLSFQTAYVIGDGDAGFRANAVNAQRVFNGVFINADRNPQTGVDGKERCLFLLEAGDEILWDDPCDTLNTTIAYRQTPPCNEATARYVDADCSDCTGVGGKETHVSWVGATAPPPPVNTADPRGMTAFYISNPDFHASTVGPAGDHRIRIEWNNSSELTRDPITGRQVFEGYRVWRVDNWQRPQGSIGPTPGEWMRVAEFRRDPSASEGARPLLDIRYNVESKTTEQGQLFNVGRYAWEDTAGIINGKLYFYAVTAIGVIKVWNPTLGLDELVELSGQPAASEAQAIVPRWVSAPGTCERVRVVPNPYHGGADWDLTPSDRDPTGTKIAFRNMPDTPSVLRIYTLSGDLVLSADHDGGQDNGTYFWNLVSRNGQNVTSGVYLYAVESEAAICRGRFVIIR